MKRLAALALAVGIVACVPLSVLTGSLRERSELVEHERRTGARSQVQALRCQDSLLSVAETAPRLARFPGYLTRGQAERLENTVRGACDVVDAGSGDLPGRDLQGPADLGQGPAGPGSGGRPADQGEPGPGRG